MLRNLQSIIDFNVETPEGYLGVIRDCFFDDQEWHVRYFSVDIADVIGGQRSLVAPEGLEKIDWIKHVVYLNVSRDKVLQSPEVETSLPISRQYEIALRRHYEWPVYWGQTSFMDTEETKHTQMQIPDTEDTEGIGLFAPEDTEQGEQDFEESPMSQMLEEPDDEESIEMDFGTADSEGTYEMNLRSMMEVLGYRIQAQDGEAGSVEDFIVDDESWDIRYIAISTKIRTHDKITLIALHWVNRVSWPTSRIIIDLDKNSLRQAPQSDKQIPINNDFERKIYAYYDHLEGIR